MSAHGRLALITDHRLPTPVETVREVAKILDASTVLFVLATKGNDRSYSHYLRSMRRLEGALIYSADEVRSDFRRIGHRMPVEDALAAYRENCALMLDFGHFAAVAQAIYDEYEPRIDEEHFGDFTPCEPAVTIGSHDFWIEDMDLNEVVYVARPFFCLAFSGWGYPRSDSMQGLTNMLLENSVIQEIRGKVEALVGPLHAVTDWCC